MSWPWRPRCFCDGCCWTHQSIPGLATRGQRCPNWYCSWMDPQMHRGRSYKVCPILFWAWICQSLEQVSASKCHAFFLLLLCPTASHYHILLCSQQIESQWKPRIQLCWQGVCNTDVLLTFWGRNLNGLNSSANFYLSLLFGCSIAQVASSSHLAKGTGGA